MPDLGPYATEVALAYAVSAVLLIALVARSIQRARASAKRLEEVERD